MRKAALAVALVLFAAGAASAAEAPRPPGQKWSFNGIFGTFDAAALKRGRQVYAEVCASCHALKLVHYRSLADAGFSEDEIVEVAAAVEVVDGPNDDGEMFTRPGLPSDRFRSPFPNEKAARAANSGAYPPDLSVITKARKGGADYLYALLIGYAAEVPEGVTMMEGMQYNESFPGQQIAMPPPLNEGAVTFADGTEATVEQMARDVTAFLTWAAEPEMVERKRLGVSTLLFLIVLTAMLYALKQRIWARLH